MIQSSSLVQTIRARAIRWITPVYWRRSERRLARALQRFSAVEYDSGWQALRVMAVHEDPEHRAELLVTALVEFHHSTLFRRLAEKRSERMAEPESERLSIWDQSLEKDQFLAAQYIGETSVHSEFEIYEHATSDPEVAATFRDIRLDEAKHVEDAYSNLVGDIGSEEKALRLIRKVRRRHDWRAVSKSLEPIGSAVSQLLLLLLYLCVGLFLWPFARRRLARE